MYERSAIILERYFDKMFGYDLKNNIKTNFIDYTELVECLEKYKNITEEEDNIIQEYERIANKIRESQKLQESLQKKNSKFQDERNNIFQNIDEDVVSMQKKLENLNNSIYNIDEDIKENATKFVEIIQEFNEKTAIRSTCGKNKRGIENEYNKKLNETLDDYRGIDTNFQKLAKKFIEMPTNEIRKEIKDKMIKNGEKEKIPFSTKVIDKAIDLELEIQKKETQILSNIYEKTNRLFNEIKNNNTKIERHKKVIKDSKCQLDFIFAIKEYLIKFLDNERLTAVNSQDEHVSLMNEACKNFEEDVKQINNLYTLLLKEITKKTTKKAYNELYNLEYLQTLEDKADEFDEQIKRLNLSVTIINPNYWRIEGMKKIYDVFYKCVTEEYERDLSEYQLTSEDNNADISEVIEEENQDIADHIEPKKSKNEKNKEREEIDKKIDMILGFDEGEENDDDWDDDWDDENLDYESKDEVEDDWNDDELDDFDDDWESEEIENEESEDDWNIDEDNEDNEDDWDDELDEDTENEEIENKDDDKIFDDEETKDDEWENEFIKIDNKKKKDKHAKKTHKKGFFSKFKKD